mgnify:FL=1
MAASHGRHKRCGRLPLPPSQRSAGPGHCFSGCRIGPSPYFPPPSIGGMERREAPREPCDRLPWTGLAIGRSHTPSFRDPSFGGGGGPGARGPLRGARAPLGAPSRTALSAAAPCGGFRMPRSTASSTEQGAWNITRTRKIANRAPGFARSVNSGSAFRAWRARRQRNRLRLRFSRGYFRRSARRQSGP